MEVKTITVIGAGTKGRGIAYVAALGGYRTILEDVQPAQLAQALDYIGKTLDEGIARGKLTAEQKKDALARLSTAASVDAACREADLIIEAVPEDLEMKIDIFCILEKFARPEAIFATNTSSLSVTEIAAVTTRAGHCVGLHFFNPVPKMKLLEIVRGLETSDQTIEIGRASCRERVYRAV
jgi:3-hydroxybutyryl-CoA dehydrogenase